VSTGLTQPIRFSCPMKPPGEETLTVLGGDPGGTIDRSLQVPYAGFFALESCAFCPLNRFRLRGEERYRSRRRWWQ
jgi:hypothetical protein